MEFKKVKFKLNLIYTGSLLFILIIFILVLYYFISNAINKQETEELERFYQEEEHEFLEEIYKNNFRHEGMHKEKEGKHRRKLLTEYEELEDSETEEYEEDDEFNFVDYSPERDLFYYVFDKDSNLIDGEETIQGLGQNIKLTDFNSQSSSVMKEIKWEESAVLLIYYPILVDHQMVGSVIVGKDITDDKQLIHKIIWILLMLTGLFSLLFALAGNLFAGQAMKPILRAYEKQRKFVSDASHELRTPLSIFYSSIDVLSREEQLSPFGRQVLEDVKQESEMMHKLLNDLLFLARNDQDNVELELEEFNLSDLLHSLLNRFKMILPPHLTLEENIQNEVFMKGDKIRIQQLFYILLDNARRYTKEGSITCSLSLQGEKIVISIKDTGIGISPEDLCHIFDRFYRGDLSRKRDGTGLGLSIAKVIVDTHGGEIDVKSEVGKGTEFLLKFNK